MPVRRARLARTRPPACSWTATGTASSPGDTLQYQITIVNSGNIAATEVVFTDTPGAYTRLVVGSVQTSLRHSDQWQ